MSNYTLAHCYVQLWLYRMRVPLLGSRLKLSEHIDTIDILAIIIYCMLPKIETSFISKTFVL